MFDYRHYVPILRWKFGERGGLRELFEHDKDYITPVLEEVPSNFTPKKIVKAGGLMEKLDETATQIQSSWGEAPLFVDLWHLDNIDIPSSDGHHPFELLATCASQQSLHIIPVTGLTRSPGYQSAIQLAVKLLGTGVCVRIMWAEIRQSNFLKNLQGILGHLAIEPNMIDILVDCQEIDHSTPDLKRVCELIPELNKWRTFTFACGAFPKDLTQFEVGRHLHRRLDWLTWYRQVTGNPSLRRIPSFGDYTIRHPIFKEPPMNANVSASIRYTANQSWVIMRGEGLRHKGSPGYAQYHANAQLLCEQDEFCGAQFSYGDKYIDKKRDRNETTGNPTTWIRATVNHHLTFVSRQIANLS